MTDLDGKKQQEEEEYKKKEGKLDMWDETYKNLYGADATDPFSVGGAAFNNISDTFNNLGNVASNLFGKSNDNIEANESENEDNTKPDSKLNADEPDQLDSLLSSSELNSDMPSNSMADLSPNPLNMMSPPLTNTVTDPSNELPAEDPHKDVGNIDKLLDNPELVEEVSQVAVLAV